MGLAMGWTLGGSNLCGGDIFLICPDRPWGPPSLLYNGYQVFPGSKVAGAWGWPPTQSSAEVKERVELYFYSSSLPLWAVLGWTVPLPLHYAFLWIVLWTHTWKLSDYHDGALSDGRHVSYGNLSSFMPLCLSETQAASLFRMKPEERSRIFIRNLGIHLPNNTLPRLKIL